MMRPSARPSTPPDPGSYSLNVVRNFGLVSGVALAIYNIDTRTGLALLESHPSFARASFIEGGVVATVILVAGVAYVVWVERSKRRALLGSGVPFVVVLALFIIIWMWTQLARIFAQVL